MIITLRSRYFLFLVALSFLTYSPQYGLAQSIDPALLRQLQGQAGNLPQQTQSPVDRARERDSTGQPLPTLRENGEAALLRDRLDAQKLREQLEANYQPTPIEREMRQRTGYPKLRQFGYDIFATEAANSVPVTGAVGDNYILGVGDELVVNFQGSTNKSITTRVDREGRLIVDQLRPISAAGRPIGVVRRELETATKATILGTDVYLSVGSVRAITIFIGGAVNRPGTYTLTSLSDVSIAIARAGGIRPNGSLRRVRISGPGHTIVVDLYGLAGIGAPPSVQLRDGDHIIVPSLGPVMAVVGTVNVPAIYELPYGKRLTVGQALEMAGNPLRPTGNDVTLSRFDKFGNERISAINNLRDVLNAGDVLIVNPREKGASGKVSLSGYVDASGTRSLAAFPTVRALLGSTADLRPGSYLPFAVLVRLDPLTRAQQLQAIDLVAALANNKDVALRGGDNLIILSQSDIDFLQSADVRRVVLGEPNPRTDCRSMIALESLVRDTQSDRFAALIRGTLLVERNGKQVQAASGGVQTRLGIKDVANATTLADTAPVEPRAPDPKTLRDALAKEDENKNDRKEKGFATSSTGCPYSFEDHPDILPFLLEHLVVINGAVHRPGAYPIARETSLATLVAIAGGLSTDADTHTVELASTDATNRAFSRRNIDLDQQTIAEIMVRSGDDVRFRNQQPTQEPGAILLTGEFVRPGLYSIGKGETLSQVVARAGGVTPDAYPYGAVLTRRSVKQAQQEGYKRTAAELNQALLAAAARKNVPSESIAAAATLASSFASAEAPGRVVAEVDPRVLAARPDLDTRLEAGDSLYMPKRPNFVLTIGDVLSPSALQFIRGKSLGAYLTEAGGLQRSADKSHIFLVYPNGVATPLKSSDAYSSRLPVPPGSSIVVPKNVDPLAKLDLIRDIGQILSQFAVSAASLAILAR